MNIGLFIPYHPKLDRYLDIVCKSFGDVCSKKYTIPADFKVDKEEVVRNQGIEALNSFDLVFTIDADEIILPDDQKKLIERMEEGNHDVGFCPAIDYTSLACDKKYKRKEILHRPAVIVDPRKVKFYEGRCLRFDNPMYCDDIFVHHLGFTFPQDVLEWKKSVYWDKKNPKEFEEILNVDTEPCTPPKELLEILNDARDDKQI